MDSGTATSLEDYRKAVAEMTAEEKSVYRSEKVEGSGSNELLWTALSPSWTIPLAKASGFPVDDVAGYFEDLQAKQIVERSVIAGENDESPITVYSMDAVAREDVIDAYVQNSQTFYRLTLTLGLIGSNILEATGLKTQLSNASERIFEKLSIATPTIARFATLAAHATSRPAIVAKFEERVEAAFSRRESAGIRDWINIAFPFSSLFLRLGDDSMKQALQRASQRLILLRREETDRRHLKHFYKRDEQYKAFKDLMTGNDSSWALHFLGAGGVGKTMLVRKITVDWAKEFDAVAARVDFDYLKAEYPTLDPGMLLWAFAQELRAYAGQDSLGLFNKAERKFEELRSQIQSEARSGVRQRATDRPAFAEAISDYCDALRLIPKRVLLIVDTCEELAKIGMGLTPVQNIHETFRILRALHDGTLTLRDESTTTSTGLASLRVIFSGRRPLASAGENWSCPSASQLDARPFLKLHPVRGFTELEAESFLGEKLKVDHKLIPAIIRRSPDTGDVARVDWNKSNHEPSRKLARCNPYDLKLYADWTREDPPPTADQILATPPATQYVELRVIRRLHDESLKQALPVVALLGHFDRRVLQHTFGEKKTPEEIDRLFDLLQQEEWINQRGVQDEDAGSNLILDVEPGIRTRLFVYYKDSPLLRPFQSRAADYLEQLTLDENPSRHDWSFYDAALTVLEADPDPNRVIRWWQQVDSNMFAACLPDWIRNATDRMQNEGGAAVGRDPDASSDVPPESRLRPAVLATYASALLRSTRRADLGVTWHELKDVWAEVLKKCNTLATETPELEMRARAGLISAGLRSGEVQLITAEIDRFWAFLVETTKSADLPFNDAQMLATILAAIEAIVEYSATKDSLTILPNTLLDERVSALKKIFFPSLPFGRFNSEFRQLLGFGSCLIGRVEAMVLKESAAKYSFNQALDLCRFESDITSNARPWRDWIPPKDVASRVRLEFIRSTYGRYVNLEELVEILILGAGGVHNDSKLPAIAPDRLENIDNDRLHSAFLRVLSGLHPIDEDEIAIYEQALASASTDLNKQPRSDSRANPARESEWTCLAHQVTPPLFVTLGELWAQKGKPDEVIATLATTPGLRSLSYSTQLHIDRACSKIISRFRLREVGEKGGQILAASSVPEDRALAWELDSQDGPRVLQGLPALPDSLSDVEIKSQSARYNPIQIEKLRWLHAIWQTRYAGDRDSAVNLIQWAEENIKGYLEFPMVGGSYEVAAIQFDCLEALRLASQYEYQLSWQNTEFKYEFPNSFSAEQHLRVELRIAALVADQIPQNLSQISHPSVVLLGIRKAAEIVTHEADLLALRLPERAARLYRLALEWFHLVQDSHSEFIAGTSEAMCVAPNKAKAMNKRLTEAFNKLNVPVTKDFASLIDRRPGPEKDWAPRGWQPRLTRYLLSLVAERDKDRAFLGQRLIDECLPGAVARPNRSDPKLKLWSADLTVWIANADQPPGPLSRLWKITKDVGRVLFGFLLFLAALNLGFRGFRWAISFAVPSFSSRNVALQVFTIGVFITTITLAIRLGGKVRQRKKVAASADQTIVTDAVPDEPIEDEYPTWRIWIDFATIWVLVALLIGPYFTELVHRWGWRLLALLLGAIIAASLTYVFRGRFSRLGSYLFAKYRILYSFVYTKIFKLTLEIFTAPSNDLTLTNITQAEIGLHRVPKSRLAGFFIGSKLLVHVDSVQSSALEPYHQLGWGLPTRELRNAFIDQRFVLLDYALMVEINLREGTLNGLCWETLVLSALSGGPEFAAYMCYRCPTAVRRSARNPQQRLIGVLFAETEPARTLRTAWAPNNDFEITNRESLVNGIPNVSIAHLVGSAESSYQSVGFRLGEESARLNAATSEAISEGDALIRAEDLVRAFPNLQICILQAEPRAIRSERLDGDRKDAFYARLFASQLSALGVACVLTIPPLERDFAIDLTRKFAGVLTHPTVRRSQLLQVVTDSRREIEVYIRQHDVSLATLQEVPQDLCLYLDTEWQGHLIKNG